MRSLPFSPPNLNPPPKKRVPGRSVEAQLVRYFLGDGIDWSGKCFSAAVNATNRVPFSLTNAFAKNYYNASMPQAARVAATTGGFATVGWSDSSYSDGESAFFLRLLGGWGE